MPAYNRIDRISEEVKRELSMIIRDLKDPRLTKSVVSVINVNVTKDLKFAKAYISVLGDEKAQKDTLAGLNSAAGYIKRTLAKNVNLRNTPDIHFIIDQSIEYGVHMSKMIDDVRKKDEEAIKENEEE